MKLLLIKKTAFTLGLFLLLTVSAQFATAQGLKIGFIDMRRIFEECAVFQQVENEIQSVQKTKAQKIEQMRNSLADEIDEYKVQKDLLPENTQMQRQQELKSKQEAFFKEMNEEQLALDNLKNQKLKPLLEQLKSVVESVANQDGYDFIFKSLDLAYGNPRYDISDKVIQSMNSRSKP